MRSKIILLLAIVMGLITTFLFYRYMGTFEQTADTETVLVEAIVAQRDIKKNELIASDMLSVIQVPEGGTYVGAVADSADIVGKYALADIAEGEPIMPHRILGEKEESLIVSRKIKEGHRAVSVGVNFVQSVSNLIEPEDIVDVIFTKLGAPELGTETESRIILEKARVLAIGRRMIETVEGDPYVEYSSVTLELTAQQSVKLVNSANDGIITLSLHGRIVPEAAKAGGGTGQ